MTCFSCSASCHRIGIGLCASTCRRPKSSHCITTIGHWYGTCQQGSDPTAMGDFGPDGTRQHGATSPRSRTGVSGSTPRGREGPPGLAVGRGGTRARSVGPQARLAVGNRRGSPPALTPPRGTRVTLGERAYPPVVHPLAFRPSRTVSRPFPNRRHCSAEKRGRPHGPGMGLNALLASRRRLWELSICALSIGFPGDELRTCTPSG